MARKYVGLSQRRGKWRVRITVDGKTHHLGTFDNEKDAAMEYDNAARRLRGQNTTRFNFPGLRVFDSRLLSMNEPVWESSDGRRTPISLLANNHLRNIERMLRYKGATIPAEGKQEHWYLAIRDEMTRRNIPPLPDHMNQLEEVYEVPIFKQTRNGRKRKDGIAKVDLSLAPAMRVFTWFTPTDGSEVPVAETDHGNTVRMDSLVTGSYSHSIDHRNGDSRDCTRKNLHVIVPKHEYKVRADDRRVPLVSQGPVGRQEIKATFTEE